MKYSLAVIASVCVWLASDDLAAGNWVHAVNDAFCGFVGAILAIAVKPRTFREAGFRVVTGVLASIVFIDLVLSKLGVDGTVTQNRNSVGGLIGFAGFFFLGALFSLLESMQLTVETHGLKGLLNIVRSIRGETPKRRDDE